MRVFFRLVDTGHVGNANMNPYLNKTVSVNELKIALAWSWIKVELRRKVAFKAREVWCKSSGCFFLDCPFWCQKGHVKPKIQVYFFRIYH